MNIQRSNFLFEHYGKIMKKLTFLLAFGLLGGCSIIPMHGTDPYGSIQEIQPVVGQILPAASKPIDFSKETLTRKRAIETALAGNPEIQAKNWDTEAARARHEKAGGGRLPNLKLQGGYNYNVNDLRLLAATRDGERGLFSQNIIAGDLVLSLPLYTGGRLVNQVKAADLLYQAASHQLARSKGELVFNVNSMFNSILAQKRAIKSLEHSQKYLTEHTDRIEALIASKKAAKVDRMRTEVRLADIEQRLVKEKNMLAIQHKVLANLLGLLNFTGELKVKGDLCMAPVIALPDLQTALAKARKQRGDYLAARAALEAQAKNVDIARSGKSPKLSVQGSYGGRWAVGSTTGIGDEEGDVGRIGLMLEMPLFEGGQVDADIREQQAKLATAQARFRALELKIQLEIETALLGFQSSKERITAIQKSVELAKESLRIEQLKYDLGKGAIVDVLDAQSALLEAETTHCKVMADYHTASAQLKLAMGE